MSEMNDRIMMVFSIITRGKAKKYMDSLNQSGIGFNIQTNGIGTAPSEMMDIFGLGSNDKDIIVSFAPDSIINSYVLNMSNDGIGGSFEYGGLMICVRLSAISRLTSELVNRASNQNDPQGGRRKVKNAQKNQLILVSVNQGYADVVMETAKRAGAMGGTILRARLADGGVTEQFGENVHQEREIITIFAPVGTAAYIMEDINRIHGVMSDANGMVFSLPVDKAYKI